MAAARSLKILLLSHSFNGLTQRLFVDLRGAGHQLSLELDINDTVTAEAVDLFQPDLLIAPFLKRPLPPAIWKKLPCLILHPGPPGDRGPSALDWAIFNKETEWGVTLLQANEILDGGEIWGHTTFPMRQATKGSLYRNEVTDAASQVTLQAVTAYAEGRLTPTSQSTIDTHHREQPIMSQAARAIDWQQDSQATILRKIRSADGNPGLLDVINGHPYYLYDAHPDPALSGPTGEIIAQCGGAICRATADGKGVWIGQLRDPASPHPFKLPATQLLGDTLSTIPEVDHPAPEIYYEEQGPIGMLHFPFYNGAMSTQRCHQLQQALQQAKRRPTRALLLLGGSDYWSNGMDLNQIEAAPSPADASWENIQAMDDLALEIIQTEQQLTISALQGNAGAGGVFLARAADQVWSRDSVVLNPHYKDMGNLYGSEYWSYLLPRYCGEAHAKQIMSARLPMGSREAKQLGLIDEHFSLPHAPFITHCVEQATAWVEQPNLEQQLIDKQQRRAADEAVRPLASYREAELEKMRMNFYGFDPSYHIARYNFVHKVVKSRTPLHLAHHRSKERL